MNEWAPWRGDQTLRTVGVGLQTTTDDCTLWSMAVMLHHDLKPSSRNTIIAVFSPATRWLFANTTHISCNVTGTEPSVFAELKRRLNYYQKFSSRNPSLTSELDGKTCIVQTRPEPLGNSLFFPSPPWWSKSPAYSSSDFWDRLWWQYLEAGELQAPIFNSDSCLLCNNCPVKKISGYFQLDWQSQLQDWRPVCWSLALQSWSQQLSPHSHTLLLLRQP